MSRIGCDGQGMAQCGYRNGGQSGGYCTVSGCPLYWPMVVIEDPAAVHERHRRQAEGIIAAFVRMERTKPAYTGRTAKGRARRS